MKANMRKEEHSRRRLAPVAICLLLSLLIHGGAVGALPYVLKMGERPRQAAKPAPHQPRQHALQIIRSKPLPTQYVKTDPDQREQQPETPDFIGKRNTSESAAQNAPNRYDDAPLPTQNGQEDSADLITFDQRQQQGELAHDGSAPSGKSASQTSVTTTPDEASSPPAEPTPEVKDDTPTEGTATIRPLPTDDDVGTIMLQNTPETLPAESPTRIHAADTPAAARASAVDRNYYDPSLAEHMQPVRGFRTQERRTRSTGRFVIGRKPALNVAATPRGRYEEEIYRRIAYFWYRACDDHQGDIIPGSVTISLRLNKRGLLENMELVRRRGASISQQSFTFKAIRSASLPPMPADVQREVVGDILELIYQFNFD